MGKPEIIKYSQDAPNIWLPRLKKLRDLICWMLPVPPHYACKLMIPQNCIPMSYSKYDALWLLKSHFTSCSKYLFESLHKLKTLKTTTELNRWLKTANRFRSMNKTQTQTKLNKQKYVLMNTLFWKICMYLSTWKTTCNHLTPLTTIWFFKYLSI